MSVIDPITKRRWRLSFLRRRQGALDLGIQADQQIERLLLRRLGRLVSVRRFVFLWLSLFILMFFCGVDSCLVWAVDGGRGASAAAGEDAQAIAGSRAIAASTREDRTQPGS